MSCKSVHCTAKMLLKAAQAEATSCPSCQLSTTASTTRRRRRSCCSMTAGYVHTPALESCADCLSLAGRRRRRRRRREAGRQAGRLAGSRHRQKGIVWHWHWRLQRANFIRAKKGVWVGQGKGSTPAGFKFGFRFGFEFAGNRGKWLQSRVSSSFSSRFRLPNLLAALAAPFASALVYTLVTRTYLQISI